MAGFTKKKKILILNENTPGLHSTNCRSCCWHLNRDTRANWALSAQKAVPQVMAQRQEVRKLAAPVLAHHIRSDQGSKDELGHSRGSRLTCDMKDKGRTTFHTSPKEIAIVCSIVATVVSGSERRHRFCDMNCYGLFRRLASRSRPRDMLLRDDVRF